MAGVSGYGGELLVGGVQLAARLGPWSMTQPDGTSSWTIHATMTRRDPFWITQRPMRLVLELGHQRWTWDNVNYDGNQIIQVFGRPREGVVVEHGS